jgi:hypothetical protein
VSHYKSHPSGIEAIEITQYESFLRGNILKYVLRAPYKGTELEDLEKAAEYLQWEIERVKEDQFWAKFDETVVKDRLEELKEMRNEWDIDWQEIYKKRAQDFEERYDYYRVGMGGGSILNTPKVQGKSFDQVVFPDKCQECEGDCKVC